MAESRIALKPVKYDQKKTIKTCKIITKISSEKIKKQKNIKTDFVGILISTREKFPQNQFLKKFKK